MYLGDTWEFGGDTQRYLGSTPRHAFSSYVQFGGILRGILADSGAHHETFSYPATTGISEEGSHVGTGWICEHLCTRRASLRDCLGTGENLDQKKEQIQALHANTNERIPGYCKVSLLVVHHIVFHGLEPL